VSDALTAVSVTARGILNVILAVPAVSAVPSSEAATTSSKGVARLPLPRIELPLMVFMFVPLTSESCFPLKVVQSAELNAPLFVALAVGRLKVCVSVAELIAKSVPYVPTAKFCT
jgi:hypothetical protein